jgi:hypothetical protein
LVLFLVFEKKAFVLQDFWPSFWAMYLS